MFSLSKSSLLLKSGLTLLMFLPSVIIADAAARTPVYTIAGRYETKSESAKIASLIDLDQHELFKYLTTDDEDDDAEESFKKAQNIYEKGMHAGSYAKLTLKNAISLEDADRLQSTAHEHDDGRYETVIGMNSMNEAVYGTIQIPSTTSPRAVHDHGIDHIMIHYSANNSNEQKQQQQQQQQTICSVGGNPEPQLEGCFIGPEGGLIVQGYGGAIEYSNYDPVRDNHFASTLMSFSEDEAERMFEKCGGSNPKLQQKNKNKQHCPYGEYDHYYQYYGQLDYGHHWIESAFHHRATDYDTRDTFLHGNEDFSLYDNSKELGMAIGTATITLNVFTQINRLLVEAAVGKCKDHIDDFSTYGQSSSQLVEEYVEAWDTAVALYAGSALIISSGITTASTSDNNNNNNNSNNKNNNEDYGTMYYGMVEELAQEFGATDGSVSMVNTKIFDEFLIGREALLNGDCDIANDSYFRIIHLMRVPLLQGVLRAASNLDNKNSNNNTFERGRGKAYLAALLPDLNQCSAESAQIVYDQLRVPSSATATGGVNYELVQDELYKNLECLRVDCSDIDPSHPSCPDGYFDAEATVNAAKTEHRYTNTRDPRTSSVDSSASSHKSSSGDRGGTHYVYGFVAVCGCVISVFGIITRRSSPTLLPLRANDILSSVTSSADYWFTNNRSGYGSRRNDSSSSSRSYDRSNGSLGSFVELGNSSSSSSGSHHLFDNHDSLSSSSTSIDRSISLVE